MWRTLPYHVQNGQPGLHPAFVLPIRTINSVALNEGDAIIPNLSDGAASTIEQLGREFLIRRSDDQDERWIARRGEVIREGHTGYRFIGVIYDVTASTTAEHALRQLADTLESRVQQE
ncbi:MAG: hypothetical protein EOO40_12935, partial [Deltaproteobacteria bacterium]